MTAGHGNPSISHEPSHGKSQSKHTRDCEFPASARRNDEKEPAALWQVNAAIREALFGDAAAARQNAAAAVALAPGSRDAEAQAALLVCAKTSTPEDRSAGRLS
jgi:hypothetical protein